MDYRTIKYGYVLGVLAWLGATVGVAWSAFGAGGLRLATGVVLLSLFAAALWFSAAIEAIRADGYDVEQYIAPDGKRRWRVGARTKRAAPDTTTRWMDEGAGR